MAMGDVVGGLFGDGENGDDTNEADNITSGLLAYLSKPTKLKRLKTFHASELRHMCCRKAQWTRAFAYHGAVWARHNYPMMQITFDIGNALHDWAKAFYLPNIPGYEKHRCHEELPVQIYFGHGVKVGGSIDDFLMNKATEEVLGVEIKTIKVDDFEKMRMAKIDHRFQAYHYLWMLKEGIIPSTVPRSGGWDFERFKEVRRFVVMYFPKQYVSKEGVQPIKTFLIDPVNDEKHKAEYEKAVINAKVKMASLVAYKRGLEPMPAGLCETKFDSKAVPCFFNSVCFPSDPTDPVNQRLHTLHKFWEGVTIESTGDPECPFLDWISA